MTGDKCLQTDLGSGPDEPTASTYYSVDDYKEILQYANDRHIQVIPEFDMPGHGYAAVKGLAPVTRTIFSNLKVYEIHLSMLHFNGALINTLIDTLIDTLIETLKDTL